MRRARLKVQATVPVRRKVQQEKKEDPPETPETTNIIQETEDKTDSIDSEAPLDVDKNNAEAGLGVSQIEDSTLGKNGEISSITDSKSRDRNNSEYDKFNDKSNEEQNGYHDPEENVNKLDVEKLQTKNLPNTVTNNLTVFKESTSEVDQLKIPLCDSSISNKNKDNSSEVTKSNGEENVHTFLSTCNALNTKDSSLTIEINEHQNESNSCNRSPSHRTTLIPGSPRRYNTNENIQNGILHNASHSCNTPCENSPIKSSRSCFMRPMPRLDGGTRIRRNSIQGSGASASESEDDSKRSVIPPRIRNDSICSIQSNRDTSCNNQANINLTTKRKITVSETARKLAEARREFSLKYDNKPPDRTKLTMYDLIYYNPINNPMKEKPKVSRTKKFSDDSDNENDSEEKDKRSTKEKEDVEEESSEMPVPQVKVGPNGQLILDEQSLVIDQYKEAQENIDRSDIIVEEDTNGRGFYNKKRHRSKEWTSSETIKFYIALNTYGTDFSLMKSVFPKRTRHELKLKYKKEDIINRELIEKALKYQEFDTEALEKELEIMNENERKEKEMKKKLREKKSTEKQKRRRCDIVKKSIDLSGEDQDGDDESENNSDNTIENNTPKKISAKKRKLAPEDIVNDENSIAKKPKISKPRKKLLCKIVSNKPTEDSAENSSNVKNTTNKKPRKKTCKIDPNINPSKKGEENNTSVKTNKNKPRKQTCKPIANGSTCNAENSTSGKIKTNKQPHKLVSNDMAFENNVENNSTRENILRKESTILEDNMSLENHSIYEDNGPIDSIVTETIIYETIESTCVDGENVQMPTKSWEMVSTGSKILPITESINSEVTDIVFTGNETIENVPDPPNTASRGKILENTSNSNKNNTNSWTKDIKIKACSSIESSKIPQIKDTQILKVQSQKPNPETRNTIESISNDINNLGGLKPGSLVIIKRDAVTDSGQSVLQVYAVNQNYDVNNGNISEHLEPVNISAELLQTVRNCVHQSDTQNIL